MVSTQIQKANVPDHVPADLVWDHNLYEFCSEGDDPYLAASRLHNGPDIFWARDAYFGEPAWVLTRRALIEEAFLDYEHFCSAENHLLNALLDVDWPLIPVEVDPPKHHAYRKILNPFFTPKKVGEMDGAVRDVCTSLISRFESRGSCEFVGEFARIFPNSIFLSLLGMPQEMLPQFLEWENTLIHGTDFMERVKAGRGILHYLQGFVAEQRVNPGTDLMKGLVSGEIEGRPITEDEILGTCYLLYVGGLDTVYSSLGWILRHLAGDQPLQERLRANPQVIPAAVDEFARAYAVATPRRTIAKDFTFHDIPMRKGDIVLLTTFLAARDPQAYENPHTVDIDRRPRSVTFATGPHTCLGLHLAKREIRIVLEMFLSRFKNIRIPEGETYACHAGGTFGVDRLPLEWDQIVT